MLARLDIVLPFAVQIPGGERFDISEYEDEGYGIRICPPMKVEGTKNDKAPDGVLVNDIPAFNANGVRVYFQKGDFDRHGDIECDPSYIFIAKTVNSFLSKLRFVLNSSTIQLIDFPRCSWHIRYLNDDETELETIEGLVKGRGSMAFTMSWTVLTNQMWKNIFELPIEYRVPVWVDLILDAQKALPDVGQSLVLATTALEVFISQAINKLIKNTTIPAVLWEWINNRQPNCKGPELLAEFDVLLKAVLGISLKESPALWEALRNLKEARNSFVHEGIAKVGKSSVSEAEAQKLVSSASAIINFIKSKLPESLQWPEYKHTIKISVSKRLK